MWLIDGKRKVNWVDSKGNNLPYREYAFPRESNTYHGCRTDGRYWPDALGRQVIGPCFDPIENLCKG